MQAVLIVEDEPTIRNGLVQLRMWNELGFEEVLDADDGASGLECIRENPHIRLVVTDIRMKKLSGLEMIEQLFERESFTGKVIILSGYDDFHYAKAAMAYGAMDYLLKPVDIAEMRLVVGRALNQLAHEDSQLDHMRLMKQAMPQLKEQLLQRLIEAPSDSKTMQLVWNELHTFNLDWLLDSPVVLMIIEPDNLRSDAYSGDSGSEQRFFLFAVGNIVEHSLLEYKDRIQHCVINPSSRQNNWIILLGLPRNSSEDDREWITELETSLRERIKQYVKISATIAYANGEKGDSLHLLYNRSQEKIVRARLYGNRQGNMVPDESMETDIREVDMLSRVQVLVDLISHGERHEILQILSHMPLLVREWNVKNLQELHRRVFTWLLEIFEAAKKAGWQQDYWRGNPIQVWESIQSHGTLDEVRKHIAGLLLQINGELRKMPRNQVLYQAEQFIREHFMEPLTVQMISGHVYVTPEWLSRLFKKNYQSTVLDYITRLRMEYAKSLLQDAGLKIYQISGMVGYRDTVYFSRLFKKHTGSTPKEFRNSRGILADE